MPRRLKKHNVISWDSPMAITNGAQDWSLVKLWISQCFLSISLHHFLSWLKNCLRTNLNKKSFPCDHLFWTFSKIKLHKSNTGKFMLDDTAEVLQTCRGGIHMISWLGKTLQKQYKLSYLLSIYSLWSTRVSTLCIFWQYNKVDCNTSRTDKSQALNSIMCHVQNHMYLVTGAENTIFIHRHVYPMVKNLLAMQGTRGSIPGLGRSSGEGNGNPLQYSCLEKSMDSGTWQATVHGVTKNRTRQIHT